MGLPPRIHMGNNLEEGDGREVVELRVMRESTIIHLQGWRRDDAGRDSSLSRAQPLPSCSFERDGKSKRTGSDWNTPNSGEAIMSASVFLLLLRTF